MQLNLKHLTSGVYRAIARNTIYTKQLGQTFTALAICDPHTVKISYSDNRTSIKSPVRTIPKPAAHNNRNTKYHMSVARCCDL